MKKESKGGRNMRKWIGMSAVFVIAVAVFFVLARGAGAQPAAVGFWVAGAAIDTAADVGIPTGPSRATNVDLCGGAGDCPSGCPKPVQNFVFINTGGGGATRLTDIVMSEEVTPGSKCRQFTAGSSCTKSDASGNQVVWYKFVATSCD